MDRDHMVEELKKKGNRLFDRDEFKKAEEAFSEAIDLAPSAALFANRALARIRLEKWDQAAEDCFACLKIEPNNAKAHARLGRAQFELGHVGDAKSSYDRAAELDPKLVELKSRWRVDVALHKLSKGGASSSTSSSGSLPVKAKEKADLSEVSRETWQLWMNAAKPNPAFLHDVEEEKEDVIGRTFQNELRKRSVGNNPSKISIGSGQRAYNAGELIMMRNDDLSAASDLVCEYAGDRPNAGLDPIFVTGKSVMMWSGKSWKSHSLALYENCFFAKSVGFFLLDDFGDWFNGMTHREHHYIALEQREGKTAQKLQGQANILAFVFLEREEFLAMIQWLKKLKPQE